jgi:membrane dipeptidase
VIDRDLHDRAIVIDALQASNWDRELLEDFKAGGITCVQVTIGIGIHIWDDARATLNLVAKWRRLFEEYADLIVPCTSGDDIRAAKAAGKTAIILGLQNATLYEDDVELVRVFADLGIRCVQLTYNIPTLLGGSCYEPDAGLTRFGRNVVTEMNRWGVIADLSHVGEKTGLDTINFSARPVAVTHGNPWSWFNHPRNKSDELLKALASRGGMLGLAPYAHLVGEGVTLDVFCRMVAYAADLMGVEHVGIGSDLCEKLDQQGLMDARMGRWTIEPEYGAGTAAKPGWLPFPDFYKRSADFPNLTAGLLAHGFSEADVLAIVGGNWLRFFDDGLRPA